MGIPPGEAGTQSPQPPGTGDTRVDHALARLDDLAGLPVGEHPAVFEYVHERLAEALGELALGGEAGPADEDAAGAGGPGY